MNSRPPCEFGAGSDGTALPEEFQPQPPWKAAAVLVPVVMHPRRTAILLTRRTEDLLDHGGQVSFPGGSSEATDRDTVETALRETEEEIGLERCYVETVGFLDGCLTITGYAVTPVVGLIRPDFHLDPDPQEVAEVFQVPLAFLRNPANRQRCQRQVGEKQLGYYQFEHHGHVIWGATARMLVNLVDMLEQSA
ncbi:MAG: CoA pyrophosphatase [Gammaproteobacteria bacterium]|nr:CoA pyrophosphatase [Gammaproteobacteria bacterium]